MKCNCMSSTFLRHFPSMALPIHYADVDRDSTTIPLCYVIVGRCLLGFLETFADSN